MKSLGLVFVLLMFSTAAFSQAPDPAVLDTTNCAMCHDVTGASRAPSRAVLQRTSPESILDLLETSVMRDQGPKLPLTQRCMLAEYLSGKKLGTQTPMAGRCEGSPTAFRLEGPSWNGWGAGEALRFQPVPGMKPAQL